jgi:hypothetical protein
MIAQVVTLSEFRDARREATRGSEYSPISQSTVTEIPHATIKEETNPDEAPREHDTIDYRAFYPLGGVSDVIVDTSAKLLREGVARFEQAIALHREQDAIGCDDCVQRVRALLPELFVWGRKIGDGFGAVILATFHSIVNAGEALTERQLLELRNGLRAIGSAPYMDFDTAMSIQEKFERVTLDPDPKGISQFGEMSLQQA